MSPTSPSQMLAGLGMVSPTQLDPYYYMTQQQPMFPRQPVTMTIYYVKSLYSYFLFV